MTITQKYQLDYGDKVISEIHNESHDCSTSKKFYVYKPLELQDIRSELEREMPQIVARALAAQANSIVNLQTAVALLSQQVHELAHPAITRTQTTSARPGRLIEPDFSNDPVQVQASPESSSNPEP